MRAGRSKENEGEVKQEAKHGTPAADKAAEQGSADLTKLGKKELLEILLRQGEEIDRLRAEVDSLKAALEDRELRISRAGSIAEASLAVTGIFEEAQKAATLYLQNVKRMVDERAKAEAGYAGRHSSEAGRND